MLEQGQNSAQNSDDLRKLTVLPVFTSFLSSAAQTALTQTQNRSTLSTLNDSLMLTSKHFLICYTFPLLRLSIYYYCPFISLEADMSVDSICSTMFNFALSSTIGQDIGLRANKSVNDVGSTMATNGADETAKTTSMEEEHNNTGEHHVRTLHIAWRTKPVRRSKFGFISHCNISFLFIFFHFTANSSMQQATDDIAPNKVLHSKGNKLNDGDSTMDTGEDDETTESIESSTEEERAKTGEHHTGSFSLVISIFNYILFSSICSKSLYTK